MRILLLTCNTGGGHNSAAAAIHGYCEQHNIVCDVRDALLFVSAFHSKVISSGHSFVYRNLPRVFGVGYRYEEKHPPRFIYNQMSLGAKKFAAFLADNSYDAIVCTHIFGSMLVTDARKRFGVTLPHYAVITDYAFWPGTDMVDAQRYFIAAEELREVYIKAGLDGNKLTASGIPVKSVFLNAPTMAEARRNLGLNPTGKIVLLFSGSIGCGNLKRVAPKFENQLPPEVQLVILCGNNKRLCKQLRKRCGKDTVVMGFTDRVAEYMAAADLCVMKPGGLSTTEAWTMALPSVLILSVPGCETHNLHHFESLNVAVGTADWDQAIQHTVELISDETRLNDMRSRLSNIHYPGGAKVVIETVLADLSKQEHQQDD